MKKIITILILAMVTSASAQSILLTEDTVLNGDQNVFTVRANGHDLTINGNLTTTGFILVGSGNITVNGNVNVGTTIFFQYDGGSLTATGTVTATDIAGTKGTLTHCGDLTAPIQSPDINYIQDCTLGLPIKQFVKTLPLGEPYIIYNINGQLLRKGNYNGIKDIFTTVPQIMVFPNKNYASKTILKPK